MTLPDGIEGLDQLLAQAGVGRFDWRDIIPAYLVPILSDPEEDEHTRQAAFTGLRAYLRTRRDGDQQVREAVADVLVPARDVAGTTRDLVPASKVYFPRQWTGEGLLDDIYGPFGQVEFLDVRPPDDDDLDRERDLWVFLGVADCPRVHTVRASSNRVYKTTAMWVGHPHERHQPWSAWLQDDEVAKAALCPQGHPESQQVRVSHVLDRFAALVAARDPRRLRSLWDALAARWAAVYAPATVAVFKCVHQSHVGANERLAPSLLKYSLLHEAWVPASHGGEVELVEPRHAWRLAPMTPKHIRARVAALPEAMAVRNRQMLAELEVTDGARLEPDDLYDVLRDLASEVGDTEPDEGEVKAARWAMRSLNDALEYGVKDAPSDPVPLLATLGGRYVFAAKPLVVREPLLRESWSTIDPVLEADEDCRTLAKVLSLVALDDHIRVTPLERGHRPDLVADIQDRIERAAPWMLALLRKLRPSAEETFVSRIKRLDVRPCTELVLEYAYDGQSIALPAAVSHIVNRLVPSIRPGGFPATAGTAYLELDGSGEPPWYEFGPQLATFVRADSYGDQFAHILASDDETRTRILAAKRITPEEKRTAADILGLADAALNDVFDVPEPDLWPRAEDHAEPGPGSDLPATPTGDPLPPMLPVPPAVSSAGAGAEPASPAATVTVSSSPAPGGTSTPAPVVLPPLDVNEITVEDGEPGPVATNGTPGSVSTGGYGGGFGGGAWTPEPPASEQDKRMNGRRGEMAALATERARVASFGFDPDEVVVWRSDVDQYAPHDIESVDETGVSVFIEVKSTVGTDPCAPFEISQGELMQAIKFGDKYRMYRVTDVRSASPKVTRYENPLALVQRGLATLDLSKARMRLGRDDPASPNQDGVN